MVFANHVNHILLGDRIAVSVSKDLPSPMDSALIHAARMKYGAMIMGDASLRTDAVPIKTMMETNVYAI